MATPDCPVPILHTNSGPGLLGEYPTKIRKKWLDSVEVPWCVSARAKRSRYLADMLPRG